MGWQVSDCSLGITPSQFLSNKYTYIHTYTIYACTHIQYLPSVQKVGVGVIELSIRVFREVASVFLTTVIKISQTPTKLTAMPVELIQLAKVTIFILNFISRYLVYSQSVTASVLNGWRHTRFQLTKPLSIISEQQYKSFC